MINAFTKIFMLFILVCSISFAQSDTTSHHGDADLSLTKKVSVNNPLNGDEIFFTIKLHNAGPDTATRVKVRDKLPGGLVYKSYESDRGGYDPSTGYWRVDSVFYDEQLTLTIFAEVNIDSLYTHNINLGTAKEYNLFVFKDLTQPSSDAEGKVAVGRDANLANYSVGFPLPNSNGTEDVLIVGNDLTFTSGAVYGGNVVYEKNTNLPDPLVSILHGTLRKDTVIDFSSATSELRNLSTQLSHYNKTGKYTFEFGKITCRGNNPVLNVFEVDGDDLTNANDLELNVPNGATVIVNVDKRVIDWSGGMNLIGCVNENVLFNFYRAVELSIHHIDVRASVLAPFSIVDFPSGLISGQVVCNKLTGSGQFNNHLFDGNLTPDTTIVNIAEVIRSNNPDPDSTPNNGDINEDDYSEAIVVIDQDDTTNVTTDIKWQVVSDLGINDVIWTLHNNGSNNYAGTLGGKVYVNNDGKEWTNITNNLTVGFIWSLAVDSSNTLYAGTEKGIYKYEFENWTLFALEGKDVRSILIDEANEFYAGTWGKGFYKYNSNSDDWNQMNDGLISQAIHAIEKLSDGTLLAGTFDRGLYSYDETASAWKKQTIQTDNIWDIHTDGDNIYVGSYGSGIFRSKDFGQTWESISRDINSGYIYSISSDTSNVYAVSWLNGVYVTSKEELNWKNSGLVGAEINSISYNKNSQVLFAAGSNGKIYKAGSSTTSTGGTTTPNEFKLYSNYPNPFNLSTILRFNLPEKSNVKIELFDAIGNKISTILNEERNPGDNKVNFNSNRSGINLTSGVYFYKVYTNKFTATGKMILLK